MKTSKDVKVTFHTILKRMWKKDENDRQEEMPFFDLLLVMKFIKSLSKLKKFYDLKDDKFCFIESVDINTSSEGQIISGYFKSARNEFRPNLIDKRTGDERSNPKKITEGDIEKSHFTFKIDKDNNEVYLFFENNYYGLTISNVINYLSHFSKLYLKSKKLPKNFTIIYTIIPGNNFLTELERLNRSKVAEVYFDKQLLGTKALNFSNRTVSLKKDIKLVATAEKGESLTEMVIDIFNKLNKADSEVTKVRVHGLNDENDPVILDTSFISMNRFLHIDINQETGELMTSQILLGLKNFAKNF